jgi:hypothetical protein
MLEKGSVLNAFQLKVTAHLLHRRVPSAEGVAAGPQRVDDELTKSVNPTAHISAGCLPSDSYPFTSFPVDT